MQEVEIDQLREAIEKMHGTPTPGPSVPVTETFEGTTTWEGVVHVFDLKGGITLPRAAARAAIGAEYRKPRGD